MDSVKVKDYSCLICVSVIPAQKIQQVNKADTHFLLQVLLEISQESQLLTTIKNSFNSIQICEQCAREIKQCKEIYGEICEKIERFWECQNKILEKFSKEVNSSKNKRDDWYLQCRKFVKDHDFTGFGYPFAVHDLETLLVPVPSPPHQLQEEVNCSAKTEGQSTTPENDDDSFLLTDDPFNEAPSPFSHPSDQGESVTVKQELESGDELADIQEHEDYKLNEDDTISSDNDSDYQPSPSKKPKISPTKRKPRGKYNKKAKIQSSQIKKRSRRDLSEIYPDFKRDPTTKKFHCTWSAEECGQQFVEKQSLHYHWDRHNGTPRQKCEECSQSFYTRRDLRVHRQKEHPKEGDKFDCEKCGKGYPTKELLLNHLRTTHDPKKEEERMARMKKKEEDPIKRDPITNKLMCYWADCDKSYLDRQDLIFHLDRHKGTPQQKCGECGELFFSKCQLVRHREKEHEKDKKFVCEICGAKFDTSSSLYGHKTFKHSEKGTGIQVVCQICGKSFKKASLNGHVKFVHGGVEERKYSCHLCPGVFSDSRGLKRHLWRMHQFCESEEYKEKLLKQKEKEKEKGFNWRCHVKGCRRRWTTEEGLKKHVDGVHKGKWDEDEDTDWKLKCEICGKGFHVKDKLIRHAKQHEKK